MGLDSMDSLDYFFETQGVEASAIPEKNTPKTVRVIFDKLIVLG